MELLKKLGIALAASVIGLTLWAVLPGMWDALFPSPPSESSLPFSYEEIYGEFLREELLYQYGRAEVGEYRYNRYGDSGEIQKAWGKSGVVSVLLEDLFGDSVPEMLTVTLVPGEKNFEYSQLEVDVFYYEQTLGDVLPVARLTDPVTVDNREVSPLFVTGAQDQISIFFRGEYLCMESMAAGQESTHTLTVYHKERFREGPEFMLRCSERSGEPLTYYLYEKGGKWVSLSEENQQKDAYLAEFSKGDETPVSQEALSYLTSSVTRAEEYLKDYAFTPLWQEESLLRWADGRTGYFTLSGGEARLLTTYENRLEADENDPNQPAVQTITDYTEWE